MRKTIIAFATALMTTAASAQIMSQHPVKVVRKAKPAQSGSPDVFTPNATIDAPMPTPNRQPMPPHAMGVSADGKSWITSVDGKYGGLTLAVGHTVIIRGHGLSGADTGQIVGGRLIPKGAHQSTRSQSTGAILNVKARSDGEALATPTRIRAGEIPWSSTNAYANPFLYLTLKFKNGQQIRVMLLNSKFSCRSGEINCD